MVQWFEGPVAGAVSQNWVCSSWPPGALKQQVSCTAVVFWQEVWGLLQVGGLPPRTRWDGEKRARQNTGRLLREAYREGMLTVEETDAGRWRKAGGKVKLYR